MRMQKGLPRGVTRLGLLPPRLGGEKLVCLMMGVFQSQVLGLMVNSEIQELCLLSLDASTLPPPSPWFPHLLAGENDTLLVNYFEDLNDWHKQRVRHMGKVHTKILPKVLGI